ncbi:HAMP domain-containing methyl-accepting chemotaxis protein [Desulfuromonas sp. AOP6]|uniref:methyl-accepting chemotaxis protein n=1 Tax=Desulfuromonas sp. AOP6 TaxID=1566351 RepID=UPI001278C7D0|nr:HAMP domain-containing methyl-accepting chemotaxis protein [Desulfuromonas sp. AOP6]BCA81043.1 methyl-accepting chemotaxis protein [Desulfuromonas sp. AOP6]
MRVEITYKFVIGFIIVIASTVAVPYVVPYLGVDPQWQQLFTTVFALLVGLVIGWFFSKAFSTNIRILNAGAERFSKGDFSRAVKVPPSFLEDETADLAASLNRVGESLRQLVTQIRATSLQVNDAAQGLTATSEEMTASAHEVANAVEQISGGAETQAEMVEKASKLIREVALSIDLVAASAQKVASSATETATTAQKGGQTARSTMERMKKVLGDVEKGGDQLFSFGLRLQKIEKIVEVITGIAEKTNLLALNASIEAARAGESGRGFAVVAQEISKLADSSARSAGEITALVEGIQAESEKVQGAMKETIREMAAGHEAVDVTGSAFEEIIETALGTKTKATSIAELAVKQSEGASSIVRTIDEISRVVTDNAASTEEVSAVTQEQSAAMEEMSHAAQELSALADTLMRAVDQFHIGAERE